MKTVFLILQYILFQLVPETLDLSIVSIVRRFANSVESEAKRGGGGGG